MCPETSTGLWILRLALDLDRKQGGTLGLGQDFGFAERVASANSASQLLSISHAQP